MERNHLEGLWVNGSMILKWIFNKWDEEAHVLDWYGLGQEQVADECEYGNEPLSDIKYGEFLDLAKDLLASQEGLCSIEPRQLLKETATGHAALVKCIFWGGGAKSSLWLIRRHAMKTYGETEA